MSDACSVDRLLQSMHFTTPAVVSLLSEAVPDASTRRKSSKYLVSRCGHCGRTSSSWPAIFGGDGGESSSIGPVDRRGVVSQ